MDNSYEDVEKRYSAERKLYAAKVRDIMSLKEGYGQALNAAMILNEMMREKEGTDQLKEAIEQHVRQATHYSQHELPAQDVSNYDMIRSSKE